MRERAVAEAKNNLEEVMCQTTDFGRYEEAECIAEFEKQILRLQLLVSHLLMKNEQLRQQLATSPRDEGALNSEGAVICITQS